MTNFVLVSPNRNQPDKKAAGQLKPYGQRDYILLDKSGSMDENGKWEEALTAVNIYIRTLRDKQVDTKITAVVFDHEYKIVRRGIAPSVCAPITNKDAEPDGGTALHDSIGKIVLQAKTDNPEKATIVIMTDGEDFGSCELTAAHAAGMLADCRRRGWQVIFLGMAFDNTLLAKTYGLDPNQTIAAGVKDIAMTMQKAAEKRAAYGQTGQRISFTDAEKKDAGKLLITGT